MQALGLEAVLTFTGLPDVLSESVASRHFPRALRLMPCCSVHGKSLIHVVPLCSRSMDTSLSGDHAGRTQNRKRMRMGKNLLDHYIFHTRDNLEGASSLLLMPSLFNINLQNYITEMQNQIATIILLIHKELKLWQLSPMLLKAERGKNGND